jgi:hypothetical protein
VYYYISLLGERVVREASLFYLLAKKMRLSAGRRQPLLLFREKGETIK